MESSIIGVSAQLRSPWQQFALNSVIGGVCTGILTRQCRAYVTTGIINNTTSMPQRQSNWTACASTLHLIQTKQTIRPSLRPAQFMKIGNLGHCSILQRHFLTEHKRSSPQGRVFVPSLQERQRLGVLSSPSPAKELADEAGKEWNKIMSTSTVLRQLEKMQRDGEARLFDRLQKMYQEARKADRMIEEVIDESSSTETADQRLAADTSLARRVEGTVEEGECRKTETEIKSESLINSGKNASTEKGSETDAHDELQAGQALLKRAEERHILANHRAQYARKERERAEHELERAEQELEKERTEREGLERQCAVEQARREQSESFQLLFPVCMLLYAFLKWLAYMTYH